MNDFVLRPSAVPRFLWHPYRRRSHHPAGTCGLDNILWIKARVYSSQLQI